MAQAFLIASDAKLFIWHLNRALVIMVVLVIPAIPVILATLVIPVILVTLAILVIPVIPLVLVIPVIPVILVTLARRMQIFHQ